MVSIRQVFCAASLVSGCLSGVALAAAGDIDPTFGNGGIVTTNVRLDSFIGFAGAFAVATLDDGGILAVGDEDGWSADFALVRWRADGELEAGFGVGGRLLTDFAGEYDRARGVVAMADGTLIVIGSAEVAGVSHFAIASYHADGSLDPTFGSDGKVLTSIGDGASAAAVVLQSDGKIVLGGSATISGASRFALARYDATGALDESFGSAGIVTAQVLGINDAVYTIAVQPDGQIVAAGDAANGGKRDLAIARFTVDGALDVDFGNNGTATTAVSDIDESIFALAIQPDGKLVAVGSSYTSFGDLSQDIVMARYQADGNLDVSFAAAGTRRLDLSPIDDARAVAVRDDGTILLAGTVLDAGGVNLDFLLVRLRPDGSLDPTFDSDGVVSTAIDVETLFSSANARNGAAAMGLRPDGTIALVGYGSNGLGASFAAACYMDDGSLDTTFSTDGIADVEIGNARDSVSDMVVLPDGRLLVAGSSFDGIFSSFAITRYSSDGTLDPTFGVRGRVTTGAEFGWYGAGVGKMFPQADGKLLVVGDTGAPTIARYDPDGTLDGTFGTGGVAVASMGPTTAFQAQEDGKLVLAGSRWQSSQPWNEFFLARLNPDGTVDPTFGQGGVVGTPIGVADAFANALIIQPDGKMIAAGQASESFAQRFALARYDQNGSLDPTFGAGGIVFGDELSGATIFALALQSDGKVVAGGSSGRRFAVARYNADGSLDLSFNGAGTVVLTVGTALTDDQVTDVLIQPDGKILLVGFSALNGPGQGFAIARLHPDGSLDQSFGSGGSTLNPQADMWSNAAVMLPGGKVVVAGSISANTAGDFVLVRYDLGPIGGGCSPVARSCRSASQSSLVVGDKTDDRRDKLVWKWIRGEPTSLSDLADPTVAASYSLCFYDEGLSLMPSATIRIPAGVGWTTKGRRGFGYRDRSGAADGVLRALVRGSDANRSKAMVKGRGIDLPDIAIPLPVPVTVQLVNERNGECFGATFDSQSIDRNEDGKFKATRR